MIFAKAQYVHEVLEKYTRSLKKAAVFLFKIKVYVRLYV